MAGKKWCEYCRLNLPYTKKDIEAHEATRQHLQNKQKAIKFERIKVRKERQEKRQAQHEVMLGTANIPKAKRGSQLQQQVRAYQDSVIDKGKRAIHRMIAQRTQGVYGAPIEYPEKQDLVLAENYKEDQQEQNEGSDNEENFEMWKIDICEKTGQPCFINRITKLVLYEPPKGYVLSEQQKEEWEYLKEICKEKVDINPQATVNITEWEEVPDQENYFEVNKAVDSDEEEAPLNQQQDAGSFVDHRKYLTKKQEEDVKKQEEKPKTWKEELKQKLINNEISTNEVFQKFIENQMKNSKTIKEKNENLKKLIESGIEVRSRPTDQILYPEKTLNKQLESQKNQQKPKVGFKPRKKVQVSAGVNLIDENDIF